MLHFGACNQNEKKNLKRKQEFTFFWTGLNEEDRGKPVWKVNVPKTHNQSSFVNGNIFHIFNKKVSKMCVKIERMQLDRFHQRIAVKIDILNRYVLEKCGVQFRHQRVRNSYTFKL